MNGPTDGRGRPTFGGSVKGGTGGGAAAPCDDDPQPVGGTADPGVSPRFSRCDHVHPLAASDLPRFQLALSYGQGATGNDDLEIGESFWFQPQSVNLSPEADQVHEWPTARELLFIGLTVFVDVAQINLVESGDDPRFIVTVDGVDTIYQIALTAGAHADELLQTNGAIVVSPGSRVGVRFAGVSIDAASTLRCEMILEGAETGAAIPPPPIPTSQLVARYQAIDYSITANGGDSFGSWTDSSAGGNDLEQGHTLLIHVPTIETNAFNAHPGVTWSRANSFGIASGASPTWYTANGPRTFVAVIRGDNIQPGTLLHTRGFPTNSHAFVLNGVAAPQTILLQTGGDVTSTPFIDPAGNKAIYMWWTNGAIGDPVFFSANGVEPVITGLMTAEDAVFFFELGYDEAVLTGSLRGAFTWADGLVYSRVLTVSERIGVLSNFAAEYL